MPDAAHPRVEKERATPPLLFSLAPDGVYLARWVTLSAVGSYIKQT